MSYKHKVKQRENQIMLIQLFKNEMEALAAKYSSMTDLNDIANAVIQMDNLRNGLMKLEAPPFRFNRSEYDS